MYNARQMSWFFPTEHGEEFLSEWYDWETNEQPVVPDAVFPEAAEVEVLEVPVPHGLVIPPNPPIAESPAVVR
ncbi:MAG: hypothetical protein GY799_25875 [Desulfobulbaceae bacterium]|nr:hypothetical protein [Desulfobulbaceae bacterium]